MSMNKRSLEMSMNKQSLEMYLIKCHKSDDSIHFFTVCNFSNYNVSTKSTNALFRQYFFFTKTLNYLVIMEKCIILM